jgi:hypothetical protein
VREVISLQIRLKDNPDNRISPKTRSSINTNFTMPRQRNYLLIDIIKDIPGLPPGGAIASQEIVNNLWNQYQALANINSKPLHTTTTPIQERKISR